MRFRQIDEAFNKYASNYLVHLLLDQSLSKYFPFSLFMDLLL